VSLTLDSKRSGTKTRFDEVYLPRLRADTTSFQLPVASQQRTAVAVTTHGVRSEAKPVAEGMACSITGLVETNGDGAPGQHQRRRESRLANNNQRLITDTVDFVLNFSLRPEHSALIVLLQRYRPAGITWRWMFLSK